MHEHVVLTRLQEHYLRHVVSACHDGATDSHEPKTIRALYDAYVPPTGHVRPSPQVVRNMIVKLADMGLLQRIDSPSTSGRPFFFRPAPSAAAAYGDDGREQFAAAA